MGGSDNKLVSSASSLLAMSFLKDLSDKPTKIILRNLRSKKIGKGTLLFQQGDVGDAMYFIYSGEIGISLQAESGQKIELVFLGKGDSFGEISLLDGSVRTATATAFKDTHLFMLDRSSFHQATNHFSNNDWHAFVKNICRNFRRSNQNLKVHKFQSGEQRVAEKLLDYAGLYPGTNTQLISLSQTQLAEMAGLSREGTNKILKTFEKKGWVKLGYREIRVLKKEELTNKLRTQPTD